MATSHTERSHIDQARDAVVGYIHSYRPGNIYIVVGDAGHLVADEGPAKKIVDIILTSCPVTELDLDGQLKILRGSEDLESGQEALARASGAEDFELALQEAFQEADEKFGYRNSLPFEVRKNGACARAYRLLSTKSLAMAG